jgi:hypothetical protein
LPKKAIKLLDVSLGILFGFGMAVFSIALYLEAVQGGSFYMLLFGAGTMISFVATFVAAMKR